MTPQTQLILLIDALGWDLAERTGFLADRLPHRRRLRSILGYSASAIPSLLTGQPPTGHGRWFLYCRARSRRDSPFKGAGLVSRLPGRLRDRWILRKKLGALWKRSGSIDGYFGLYDVPYRELVDLDYVERRDSWKPGTFPARSYVDDLAARPEGAFISDWRMNDDEKFRLAIEAAMESRARFFFLYLTEVDARQHAHGSHGEPVRDRLTSYRAHIDQLLAILERRGPVAFSVCSDHGMTDVRRLMDPSPFIRSLGLADGRDFRIFVDSTFLRFWPEDERSAGRIREVFSGLDWCRVLERDELEREGVLFPDDRYGRLFILANPGVLICPSYMGRSPLLGMHGYTPEDSDSDAVLLRGVDDAEAARSILDLRRLFSAEISGMPS